MYERCISTWSSTGSMRPPRGGTMPSVVLSVMSHFRISVGRCVRWQGGGAKAGFERSGPSSDDNAASVRASRRSSDVEEADVFGVALDERPALLDVLAHQDGEHLVGLRGVLQR